MKTKSKVYSIISILVLLFIAMFSVVILWKSFTAPNQFVSNETFVKSSDLLFDYEITKYPSNVEIIPYQYGQANMTIGFVTDPWNLNFGIIPNGGNFGTRHLLISNFESKKVRISLDAYGTIKPLVSFSKNNFALQPKESVSIDVFLNTTESTKPGNYAGEIDITVMKPRYEF